MGSCYSKKKKQVPDSPRTAQERYNARRNAKPIYPPLSSIPNEEPKRFITPDGRSLYQSVEMDNEIDTSSSNYQTDRSRVSSNFPNHYHQYNDGLFAVLARYPMNDSSVFRV